MYANAVMFSYHKQMIKKSLAKPKQNSSTSTFHPETYLLKQAVNP